MTLILINEEAVNFLRGKNTLLDGYIKNINISVDDGQKVKIDVKVQMRRSAEFKELILEFLDCKKFTFNYSDAYHFYCIESIKLTRVNDSDFYISFDPYDDVDVASSEDQDVIISRSICLRI